MKRIAFLAAAGWLLAGTLPAWALTQPASRAALPDARTLPTQMGKVIQAKNTVHMVIDSTSKMGNQPATTSHTSADISYHPLVLKEDITAGGVHQIIIMVGNHIATELNHHWTCIVSKQIQGQYAGIIKNLTPANIDARTVGATTVAGISVWHITMHNVITGEKNSTPADLYVSRTDGTLVEITTASTTKAGTITITSHTVERLSNYGEHLSIAVPSACQK